MSPSELIKYQVSKHNLLNKQGIHVFFHEHDTDIIFLLCIKT